MNIGPYAIVGELGRGGMGVVLKATDSGTGQTVAIKLIKRTGVSDERSRIALVREAGATASLQHPNIVSIYDINQHKGSLYIVMEFLSGASLEKLICGRAPLDVQHKLKIVITLCEALAYAHGRGIVHRDVKPANIFIKKDGTVKVVDFGIAALAQVSEPKEMRWSGTVPYMSPEQVNGRDLDSRSDIWSAGITLFRLLTGKLPFVGDTRSIFNQILNSPLPELPVTVPVSHELNRILHRSVHKNRLRRYASADLFAADLKQLLSDTSPSAWIAPPDAPTLSDNLTQETLDGIPTTSKRDSTRSPYNVPSPPIQHEGQEQSKVDTLYSPPDLGFKCSPTGQVNISSGRSSLRRSIIESRWPIWSGLFIFALCSLEYLRPPFNKGMVVTACVLGIILESIWAVEKHKLWPRCSQCERRMHLRSLWKRYAQYNAEVGLCYRDCLAALGNSSWEDAAKLFSIHGVERSSSESSICTLRNNLELYECETCAQHLAILTAEELINQKWLPRVDFVSVRRGMRSAAFLLPEKSRKGSLLRSAGGVQYLIEDEIDTGRGWWGAELFLASTSPGVECLIKLHDLSWNRTPSIWQESFRQGSPIPGVPVHHNIAAIVDGGIADTRGTCVRPFLVFERFGGRTLRTRLGSGLSGTLIRSMAAQIADAIDAAHLQGVVLKTLNPNNVLFESAEGGRVVIVFDMYDLYLKCFEPNAESPTMPYHLNYLDPELFGNRRQCDASSDIYSFAVILFEMIAGRRPYASWWDGAQAMKTDDPTPDIRKFRDVPKEISVGLSKMLNRDPLRRPSSATEAIAGMETQLLQLQDP